MNRIILSILGVVLSMYTSAQIGYQIALIDQSTGKARVNETVSVTLTLSDNDGGTICTSTQSATTNEFGILSVTVGSASTFDNVDWSKLPLWIEARVGNVIVGKSQVLNVPVAEHAKHTGTLTKEILTSKTWYCSYSSIGEEYPGAMSLHFYEDGTCSNTLEAGYTKKYKYSIDGNMIYCYPSSPGYAKNFVYSSEYNTLFDTQSGLYYK